MLNEFLRQTIGLGQSKKKHKKSGSGQVNHYHYHINNFEPSKKEKKLERKMLSKMQYWTDWQGRKHYYKRYY